MPIKFYSTFILIFLCGLTKAQTFEDTLEDSKAAFKQQNIVIENEFLKVRISEQGAELQSIFSKKTDTEILWQGDPEYWEARSPIMFPVNVRYKDEKYTYKGKMYEMPRMGLAVISSFSILSENTGKSVTLVMNTDDETKRYYPFDFQFEVRYELMENELINRFTVRNIGQDTMYFALGGHPGFNCSFDDGRGRDNYQYVFPEKLNIKRIEISNSLVQNNQIPFLENEDCLLLSDPRIPDGGMFMKNHNIDEVGVAIKGENPFVTLKPGIFPNLNLWSPPGMPFACIEPMVSHHDTENSPIEIEKKTHLIKLPPQEEKTYWYIIKVATKETVF
jgi:galactose mutarotase-like enzyme